MILNLLNEKLKLNEDINLDNPAIYTDSINIYEITDIKDFENFTMDNNEDVAKHYGFTQNNWQEYVVSGKVKPFVISKKGTNNCLAMFLLWKNGKYTFKIRPNKVISIPLSFECPTNREAEAYNIYLNNNTNGELPLYEIFKKYQDFTKFNPDEYIADGQYIKDGVLKGIFKEFFKLDNDGKFDYPEDIDLNKLNLKTLDSNSIVYKDFGDPLYTIHINFYDNLTTIPANAIDNEYADLLWYCGLEDELPKVFDKLPENVRDNINFQDGEEINKRRAELRAQREKEAREAQEAEDKAIAQEFDDDVVAIFDTITADDYEYDANLDTSIEDLLLRYDALTDQQRKFQTTNGNLQIAVKRQNELKTIELNNKYKRLASEFLDNFEQVLSNIVKKDDYIYSRKIDDVISSMENKYNTLSDDVKDKLVVDFDFDFKKEISEIKDIQQKAKDRYNADIVKRLDDNNLILIADCIVAKVVNNEISIINSRRSLNNEPEITIPDTINGLKVTRIEKNAFLNNKTIKKLYLPETIRYIGAAAFYNSTIKVGFKEKILDNGKYRAKIKLAQDALNFNCGDDEVSMSPDLNYYYINVDYYDRKHLFSY